MHPKKLQEVSMRLAQTHGIRLTESDEFNSLHHLDQAEVRKAVYDLMWSRGVIK